MRQFVVKPERNADEIEKIQAIADRNAEKYGIDIKLGKKPNQ